MQWSTACPDWAARLKAGQSIIPPPIFPAEAERALAVFKALRIVDAPGSPTFGEACAQWVFDLVASIFGAYDSETGRRLITEWFVCLPKKNSTSTIAAGIAMMQAGDVLLVAGKGHETGQIVGSKTLPFSDHEAVRAALGVGAAVGDDK